MTTAQLLIRALLPQKVYRKLQRMRRRSLARKLQGDTYHCPFCSNSFSRFLPLGFKSQVFEQHRVVGAGYRENAQCPRCSSSDRERLLFFYLRNTQSDLLSQPLKLLHVAPEPSLGRWLRSIRHIDYLSADLSEPRAMVKIDITEIPDEDNSFDVIICNHVLEHIPDDTQAMRELHRVLKPGGFAILQAPVSFQLETTYEDDSITTPRQRLRAFGQPGHVRVYGRDYTDRLAQAGFEVDVHDAISELDPAQVERYALNTEEKLFICKKAAA